MVPTSRTISVCTREPTLDNPDITFVPVVTGDDYAVYAAQWATARPDRAFTIEEMKESDAVVPAGVYHERVFLCQSGSPVAGGELVQAHWSADPHAFEVYANLPHDLEPRLAEALVDDWFTRLKHAGATSARIWVAHVYENVATALKGRGLHVKDSNQELILKFCNFSCETYQKDMERFETMGFKVSNLADLIERDSNGMRVFYDLRMSLMEASRQGGEQAKESFEQFEKRFNLHRSSFSMILIAFEGGRPVATTGLFRNPVNPQYVNTGFTGVSEYLQGRGIATALKILSLKRAKESGAVWATCDNDFANPILDLNKRLGFEPHWVWNAYG